MAKSCEVKYKNEEGKDCVIIVKKPNHTQLTEAQLHSAKIFNQARKSACLRSQIDDWLEDQGVWSKEHREEIKKLEQELVDKIESLATATNKDGSKMKLSEGRALAIEIRIDRFRLNLLQAQRRAYDEYTVEGQSENARFDYLCSLCLLDEDGNRLFKSIDEYHEGAEKYYISEAAAKLANLIFGTEDWEKNLPENQFLVKHNMVDSEGRLVNKDGKFIDRYGKVIDSPEVLIDEVKEPEFMNDLE